VKRILFTGGSLVGVLAAIILAEVPPMPDAAAWIDARRPPLLMGVAIVLALGFGLFLGGIIMLVMDRDRVLSHAEVENVGRSVRTPTRQAAWRATHYRFFGTAAGRRGDDSFRLKDFKAAWRRGAIWRDAEWRRRFVTTVGALSLVVGIFGLLIVVGPPWIKVLGAGALIYAFVRLGWGMRRV